MFVLDGGFGFGPPAMMQAIAIATERARTLGVGFGLVRETTHTGAVGRYAQWMAERGSAALIMVSGPAFVAYHGTRVASMGTSPIAIAVPSGERPDRARHGDQHDFKRHDHPGAGQQHRIAGRNRADSGGRADNRPAPRGHPAAARRTQGVGTGADVRDADERARRRADPGARARTGAAETAHAELRHPRHRCRRFPAACRFYPRRRYARGVAQNFAAAGRLRRDPAAGRALRPHRGQAPRVRYSGPGKAVGRAEANCGSKRYQATINARSLQRKLKPPPAAGR